MILMRLRDSLRDTILKRPIATCLSDRWFLFSTFMFSFYFLLVMIYAKLPIRKEM